MTIKDIPVTIFVVPFIAASVRGKVHVGEDRMYIWVVDDHSETFDRESSAVFVAAATAARYVVGATLLKEANDSGRLPDDWREGAKMIHNELTTPAMEENFKKLAYWIFDLWLVKNPEIITDAAEIERRTEALLGKGVEI